jgi:hypothetical protein
VTLVRQGLGPVRPQLDDVLVVAFEPVLRDGAETGVQRAKAILSGLSFDRSSATLRKVVPQPRDEHAARRQSEAPHFDAIPLTSNEFWFSCREANGHRDDHVACRHDYDELIGLHEHPLHRLVVDEVWEVTPVRVRIADEHLMEVGEDLERPLDAQHRLIVRRGFILQDRPERTPTPNVCSLVTPRRAVAMRALSGAGVA